MRKMAAEVGALSSRLHSPSPTAVVADNRPLIRGALTSLLRHRARIEVVGEAGRGEEVPHLVAAHSPNVLLMQVGLPGPPVSSIIGRTRHVSPQTRIVILAEVLEAGVDDVLRTVPGDALVGWDLSPTGFIQEMHSASTYRGDFVGAQETRTNALTVRQIEVLDLVARGMTNIEVGDCLYISPKTVKRHLADIFVRLHARSRIDAVNKATAAALLPRV